MIRIIGIGSPFGDDAVGLEVARRLLQQPPRNCEVIVADRPGTSLIELLDGIDAVILIDAVRSGGAPGTLCQLSFDELATCSARFNSSHDLGLMTAIQLALKLGRAAADGRVLGIEIASTPTRNWCPLTRTARQAVGNAVAQVRLWVEQLNALG